MAAGDAVVKGTNAFTEQPYQERWMRGRGWQKVRIFEGPLDESLIAALKVTLVASNCEDIYVRRGWPTVVEAAVPSNSNTVGVGLTNIEDQIEWSLEPYDIDKPLGTHGAFNYSGSSAQVLAVIEKELKTGEAYGKDYNTIYGSTGQYNNYVSLRGQGTDSYWSPGFVLRKTLVCERANIVAREFQQNAEYAGKIIKWDDIKVPDNALIERPKIHFFDGPNLQDFTDEYVDEWLVKPVSIRYVKEGKARKRQLVQEFLGAIAWSGTLYDGGGDTP